MPFYIFYILIIYAFKTVSCFTEMRLQFYMLSVSSRFKVHEHYDIGSNQWYPYNELLNFYNYAMTFDIRLKLVIPLKSMKFLMQYRTVKEHL